MAEPREIPRNEYTVLPPHLRPRYESRSDFRLMAQSFRHGWAEAVPAERKEEWYGDMTEALHPNRKLRFHLSVIRAFLAASKCRSEEYITVLGEVVNEMPASIAIQPGAIAKEVWRRVSWGEAIHGSGILP